MSDDDDRKARVPDAVIPPGQDASRPEVSHTGGSGIRISFSFGRIGRQQYPVYGPPHDPNMPPFSDGYVQYRPPAPARRWINYALFIATCLTTFFAGVEQGGIVSGFQFSITLMGILLAHEMGHFFMARRHGVNASLPYFLPMPLGGFGTLGAIILMRSRIPNRQALLDIGVAGPIAGMFVAVPASYVGLLLSKVQPLPDAPYLTYGDSLFFKFFQYMIFGAIPRGHDVFLHPVAMAGWAGMFITALNLLPIGQLDGGHVAYAVFGRRHVWVARLAFAMLLFLGGAGVLRMVGVGVPFGYPFWLLPALLIVLLIKIRHPPVDEDGGESLDQGRVFLAVVAMVLFVLTFVPTPLSGF